MPPQSSRTIIFFISQLEDPARGEALPSIGSVSRLKITSIREDKDAWELSVERGVKSPLKPAQRLQGSLIEVRDLFDATPARLQLVRATSTEGASSHPGKCGAPCDGPS